LDIEPGLVRLELVDDGLAEVESGVTATFDNVNAAVTETTATVQTTWETGVNEIVAVTATGFETLNELYLTGTSNIVLVWSTGVEDMLTASTTGFANINTSAAFGMVTVNATVSSGMTVVVGTLLNFNAILAGRGAVAAAAGALVQAALDSANATAGAASPATEAIDLGQNIDEGLYLGLLSDKAKVAGAANDLVNGLLNEAQRGIDELGPVNLLSPVLSSSSNLPVGAVTSPSATPNTGVPSFLTPSVNNGSSYMDNSTDNRVSVLVEGSFVGEEPITVREGVERAIAKITRR
jgi:hypothetical protein